jgi:very-short-patch-repair endonuclease
MIYYNTKLRHHSRLLRTNMTKSERLLWMRLRRKQLKDVQFYRQRIIGNYIVDFYCPKAKLIIELDGGQHFTEMGIEKDSLRDNYLMSQGLKVLRFSDRDVFENLEGVLEKIFMNL